MDRYPFEWVEINERAGMGQRKQPRRAIGLASAVLLVAALLVPHAGAATTTVLQEGFEGGTFPPSGWSVPAVAPSSTFNWSRVANCASLNGNACIEAQGTTDSGSGPEDKAFLAVPQFSTADVTSPKLELMVYVTGSTSTFRIVKKHTSGDTQYEDSLTVPALTAGQVNQVSINLTANTTYDIALGFVSFNDPLDIVRLDSLVVSGTTADPPPNTAPTATNVAVSGLEDQAFPVRLQGADAENAISYSVLTQPVNGTLSGSAPLFTYTPKKDWNGTDSFTYKVNDGSQDSNTATVTLTVSAMNDQPVVTMPATADSRQGQQIVFTSSLKREVKVADIESQTEGLPVNFYVAAAQAPATLQGDITGLTFTSGDGTDDSYISGSGTIPAINAALSKILVDPPKTFTGTANLTVGIDDRGQTGLGIAIPVENHTAIEISGGPDAFAALPDKPQKSAVGLNVFDDTGAGQTMNTDVCWCITKVTLGSQTAGLTQEDVKFKIETTGDLVDFDIYEGQDGVTKQVKAGTYSTTVYPGYYGGRSVRMELYLKRQPTTPDEEQVFKFTVTSVPGSNDPEPATSDVVLIKVKARNYKPDLLISQEFQESGAIGNDRYEDVFANSITAPAAHQQFLTPKALQVGGNAAGFNIWIQNDGTSPDIYDLQGDSGSAFDVFYYDKNGQNITSQVTSGTYKTNELDPKSLGGNSQQIRMVLQARQGAAPGTQERFRVRTVTPGHSDGDIVSVLAEIAQDIQPDIAVISSQASQQIVGYGKTTEHFGVATRMYENGEIGATSSYLIWLDNMNATKTGRMYLQGNVTQPGYSVRFVEQSYTSDQNGPVFTDVTTQMKGGTYEFDLEFNRIHMVWAYLTVGPTANPFGFANELKLQAISLDGLPKNRDHFIIETKPVLLKPDITGALSAISGASGGAGNDIYSIGGLTGPQTLSQDIGAGETAAYNFNISEDGVAQNDVVSVQATTTAQPGYTIKWFDNKNTDITSAIAAGTYTLTLEPNSPSLPESYKKWISIRAEVRAADDSAKLPPQVVSLTVTSSKSIKDPKPSDTFTTKTTMAYRPDLVLVTSNGRGPTGAGIFSRTLTTETNTENLKVGVVNDRFLAVTNAGTKPDSYLFNITPPTGMKVTLGTNTTPGNTFTTGLVQPGQLITVPMKIKLPSSQEIDRNITMGIEVKSVTRPGAQGDSGTMTYTPKFECVPNFTKTIGNIQMSGNCVQVTDEGFLMSSNFTINRLDFSFGSKVAFFDTATNTLTATDVTIKYAGSNVVIFDAPGKISLPLTSAGGTLNGDGTSSSVYGMQIGYGPVTIKFPSANNADVSLPLKPIPMFGQGAASQPLTVPATGAAPPTAPPAGTTMEFPTLQLGPIGVGDVITKYDAATQTWLGYGRAGFPNLPVPKLPAVEIAMQAKGGTLNFAYLRMKAGVAGIQVGPMTVNKLEAEVRLNPTQVIGSIGADLAPTPVTLPGAGEKKLPLFSVDGKFYVSDYKLSIKGAAKLLGILEFGSFQATYEYGGVMRMTAILNHSIDIGIGNLGVRSEIDGSVDTSSGRFQIVGTGTASLGKFSAGIEAVLSTKGIAACGKIDLAVKTVGVGFGMKWSNASIQAFTGCNLDDYKDVDAPPHVDFDSLSAATETLLGQVDPIRAQIASASAALKNIGLPSLSGL
ncbi:MAG: large repetitive protein [Actinomycetota bacterium]|jgi:hypothetical protein|nr:large repetitive protein [Actinomycetota bacterium]